MARLNHRRWVSLRLLGEGSAPAGPTPVQQAAERARFEVAGAALVQR